MKHWALTSLTLFFLIQNGSLSHAEGAPPCVSLDNLEEILILDTPLDPCTLKPVSLLDQSELHIALAAHPDDEIGIIGTLAKFVSEGKTVIYEVFTDGHGSSAQGKLNHMGHYLSDQQFGNARRRESIAEMRKIGVFAIVLHDLHSMKINRGDVKKWINQWTQMTTLKRSSNGKAHKTEKEIYFYGTAGFAHDQAKHPDHEEIYQALNEISGINKAWYLVYAFRDLSSTLALWPRKVDITDFLAIKQSGLDEFRYWSPEEKRFSIGWTYSTPDIFVNAYDSKFEFMVFPGDESFQWTQPTPPQTPPQRQKNDNQNFIIFDDKKG